MPSEEQAKHNKDNAQQLIDNAKLLATANNDQIWKNFFNKIKAPEIPILVQSLLSKEIEKMGVQFVKADKKLIEGQTAAMNRMNEDGFHIMYHNNGTNAFSRGNKICMQGDQEFEQLVNFAKYFLNHVNRELAAQHKTYQIKVAELFDIKLGEEKQQQKLDAFIIDLKNNPLFTAEQQESLSTILRVLDEYYNYDAESQLSRNKAEYIISLKKMLVEAMGGVVTNNCKSGKDRTGQSEVYQHAFTLTMQDYPGQELLHYDENGDCRDLFCENSGILNASQKIQESAAFNTPGSVGTKAPEISMIIDDEVRENEYFSTLHKIGCSLAGMNKPILFSKDEKDKAMEQNNTADKTKDMRQKVASLQKEPDPGAYTRLAI